MRLRPSRVRRLRARRAIGNAVLATAVLAVGAGYLAVQKTVTLVVEGRPEAVRTMSSSVGELLDAKGIVLERGDVVVPAAVTPLADGMTVVVHQDLPAMTVVEPPAGVGVWVVEGESDAHALFVARQTEKPFSAGGADGVPQAVAADVVVLGKAHDVLTNAVTVRELLSAMGIDPDRNDRVLPPPSTPLQPGMKVRYVQIDFRIRELEVPIPHTTFTRYSGRVDDGAVRILRTGSDGLMRELFRVKVIDGEVVARKLLDRHVIRSAVAARRVVGRENASHGAQVGEASWYSFAPGSGLTAAHPWLPFGTVVTVTNLSNGKSVQVVINDRGPFGGRIIDLSDEAFARIAPLSAGVCRVRLTW